MKKTSNLNPTCTHIMSHVLLNFHVNADVGRRNFKGWGESEKSFV